MFMFEWSALMTPHKATLVSLLTLSWFVSYQRLTPKFQYSLSDDTLGIYLDGSVLETLKQKQGWEEDFCLVKLFFFILKVNIYETAKRQKVILWLNHATF